MSTLALSLTGREWSWLAALSGMAGLAWLGVLAVTPKRQPGRHAPDATEPREESGADVAYAAELHDIKLGIAEEPELAGPGGDDEPIEEEPPTGPGPDHDEPTHPDDPMWWGTPPATGERWTASPDEPTPLFHAAGRHRYPPDLEIESFTHGWDRAELLARIRRVEAQQAGVEAA